LTSEQEELFDLEVSSLKGNIEGLHFLRIYSLCLEREKVFRSENAKEYFFVELSFLSSQGNYISPLVLTHHNKMAW